MFLNMIVRISKYPLFLFIVILGLSAWMFVNLQNNSRMETDLDEYMPSDHPAFVYSDKAEEWFNIKDGIIFAIESPDGIYNPVTLKNIRDLTIELRNHPKIEEGDITSLYNADNIIAYEGGLEVEAFYNDIPKDQKALRNLEKSVKDNEMVYKRIVSENGKVALVIANINDDVFTQEFYNEILSIAEKYRGQDKIHVAGRPIVEGNMALLAPRDMKKMVPIVVLVITIVLLLVLKSLSATITTLLVVILSTLWTFGLMALLRIPIYAVSTMIPVMLIAIGVADGIHLYNHLRQYLRENPHALKKDAISDMIHAMAGPVIMTSVTTSVGFLALLTSSVYPIKYFGVFTGFGVLSAMVLSLTLIPGMVYLFGLPKVKQSPVKDNKPEKKGFIRKYLSIIDRNKHISLYATIIIIGISVYGISRVWINSSFLDKFEKDSDIVQTDAFINKHFGGTTTLNVILESNEEDIFKNPEVLNTIDSMQNHSENIKEIGNTFSITDYIKRMNKVMHSDSTMYESIPNSKNLIAQYILLYEMSGNPENLYQLVDYDYKRANVTFQLNSDDSKTLNSAIRTAEDYEAEFKKHGISMNFAGSGYKSLVFSDLILYGQISSLIVSLVIVAILITIMFKSILLGLIGSVPIAITAIISFGIMGLSNIALSTTTALLSSIAIGIGIDYAIHFIDRFKHYFTETGSIEKASLSTMNSTGRAILFNALVVVSGFLVLLFSVFPPNRILGMLVSLNMSLTFIATVTIMYLLLHSNADRIWKDSKNRERKK